MCMTATRGALSEISIWVIGCYTKQQQMYGFGMHIADNVDYDSSENTAAMLSEFIESIYKNAGTFLQK